MSNYYEENEEENYFDENIVSYLNNTVKENLKTLRTSLEDLRDKYEKTLFEKFVLEDKLKEIGKKDSILISNIFSSNKIDLKSFIDSIGFNQSNEANSQMDNPPNWFYLICKYYDNKEDVLKLYDFLGIEYPDWLKTFVIPYEYDEDQLDLFFKNMSKHYVCNGCIYEGNLGFWFNEWHDSQFDPHNYFSKKNSYSEIPWQLILKNSLLKTEKYFNRIVKEIENNSPHSSYFYAIDKYQKIEDDQIDTLVKLAIRRSTEKNDPSELVSFLKRNFTNDIEFLNLYKHKISENSYNVFYLGKFPKEIIIEYIINKNCSISEKLLLAKKIDISEEELLKLIVI
jgi:hypothetical protein